MIRVPVEESKRDVTCFDIKDEEVTITAQHGTVPGTSKGGNFRVGFTDEIKKNKSKITCEPKFCVTSTSKSRL